MTTLTIGAITDEFSSDLGVALDAMSEVGMSGVELRVVDGKNVIDLTDDELEGVRRRILARGMHVVGIASPDCRSSCSTSHSTIARNASSSMRWWRGRLRCSMAA